MSDTHENSETATTDTRKQVKEVAVVQDEGFFCHDTGDTYNGFFEAKKKDKSVKMHGKVFLRKIANKDVINCNNFNEFYSCTIRLVLQSSKPLGLSYHI